MTTNTDTIGARLAEAVDLEDEDVEAIIEWIGSVPDVSHEVASAEARLVVYRARSRPAP